MRTLNVLAAFLGGAVIGGTLGILFAPEDGERTRRRIAIALRRQGINLKPSEMRKLVDEIASEIKPEED